MTLILEQLGRNDRGHGGVKWMMMKSLVMIRRHSLPCCSCVIELNRSDREGRLSNDYEKDAATAGIVMKNEVDLQFFIKNLAGATNDVDFHLYSPTYLVSGRQYPGQ